MGAEFPVPQGFIETKSLKNFALFLERNNTEQEFFLVQTFNNRFSFSQMPIFSFSEKEFTQVAEGKKLVEGIIVFKIADLNLLKTRIKTEYILDETENLKDYDDAKTYYPEITWQIFNEFLMYLNTLKGQQIDRVKSISNFLSLNTDEFAKLSADEQKQVKRQFLESAISVYRTDMSANSKTKAMIDLINSYYESLQSLMKDNKQINSLNFDILFQKDLKILLKEVDYRNAFKYSKQRVLTDVRFTELSENYDISEASGVLVLKYFANWIDQEKVTNNNKVEETFVNQTGDIVKVVTADGTSTTTNLGKFKLIYDDTIDTKKYREASNATLVNPNATTTPLIVLIGQSKQVYIKYKVKKGDEILKLENKLGLKHGTPFYRLEKGKYNPIKNRDYILEKETIYYQTATPKDNAILTPYAQAIVQRQCTVKDINLEQGGKCYVLQNKKYAPIPEDITLYQNNKIYFTKTGSEDKTRETTFNKELFDKDYNVGNKKVYVFEPYTFKKGDTVWDLENDLKVKVYKTPKKLSTTSKNFFTKAEVKKIPIGRTVYLTTPGYEDKQNNTLETKK